MAHQRSLQTKPSAKGKAHNGRFGLAAKVKLRENVLAHVAPAHVFDAYCGPEGEMWRRVWIRAASYVGCDEVYVPWDPRTRFVGDNRRVMRAIDLGAFNVFDLDAFAEPWEQLAILGARRAWSPGERGAIVLTWNDGFTRRAGASHALADVAGLTSRFQRGCEAEEATTDRAVRRFLRRQHLTLVHAWSAHGQSESWRINMTYLALVIEGAKEPAPTEHGKPA